MKKTLILVAALGVVGVANAQSFTESFDSFTVPGPIVSSYGFTADNAWEVRNYSATQGTTNWFNTTTTTPFPAQAGAGYAGVNFNTTTGSNDINTFLMSDVRTFNNGDTISFWTRQTANNPFPDNLLVKLSTNGAGTADADFATTLLNINPALTPAGYPSVWTQYTITLTGLSGPSAGRFAFNYKVPFGGPFGDNSNFIGIDTVAYTAVPEPASMTALALGAAAMLRRRNKKA